MARMASADIMCVGPKSVREKFTGTIRFVILFSIFQLVSRMCLFCPYGVSDGHDDIEL